VNETLNTDDRKATYQDLLTVTTREELHAVSLELALANLSRHRILPEPDTGDGLVVMAWTKRTLLLELFLSTLVGPNVKTLEVTGRTVPDQEPCTILLASWLTYEQYRRSLGWTPVAHTWISAERLAEGATLSVFQDELKALMTMAFPVDTHALLDQRQRLDQAATAPSMAMEDGLESDLSFDYTAFQGLYSDEPGLCYSHCQWSVGSDDQVNLSEEPHCCWEAHHNARLWAAAPMLYEVLRAVRRGAPDAQGRAIVALKAVEDAEWNTFFHSGAKSQFGSEARDFLRLAGALPVLQDSGASDHD